MSPLRCRCWRCDHCAPRRAKELRWQARNGAPTIFLTLTIRAGRFASPDAQARELKTGWTLLRQYLCRRLGWKSIPFLAVVEKHKNGWPHLHVLLRCTFIHHKLIRAWWVERFDSPMIFITRLHDARQAAVYVTKYLAKSPEAFLGCKRYWASRDYKLPDKDRPDFQHDDDVWFEALTLTPIGMARLALTEGATVTFDGPRIRIDHWSSTDRCRIGLQA